MMPPVSVVLLVVHVLLVVRLLNVLLVVHVLLVDHVGEHKPRVDKLVDQIDIEGASHGGNGEAENMYVYE